MASRGFALHFWHPDLVRRYSKTVILALTDSPRRLFSGSAGAGSVDLRGGIHLGIPLSSVLTFSGESGRRDTLWKDELFEPSVPINRT